MKRLLLLLLTFALPIVAMQQPKRKHEESVRPHKIDYIDHSAFEPFSITAFDGEIKAGYIDFGVNKINPSYGHIKYIHVYDSYRGKGIGYKLFKKAIFALKKKGFRVITWDTVSLDNVPTEELEQIYLAYILKLKDKLEFDFIMEKQLGFEEYIITPMKLIIKNTHKQNRLAPN